MAKKQIDLGLTGLDELFMDDQERAESKLPKIHEIPLSEIDEFPNHPFHVRLDEDMDQLVESIKERGIITPVTLRQKPDGRYEIVSGHRRTKACELAGLTTVKAEIKELSRDEAIILMVESNLQRTTILPSEKAHAYKMKYEAMKHQGSKGEKHTADLVGEAAGESGRTVQRYIRLSFLISRLLDYVDNKRLSMKAGEKLSFLTVEEQEWVLEAIDNAVLTVTDKQAELFKNHSREKTLNQGIIYSVLLQKKEAETKVTLSAKKVRSYFPPAYTKEQVEEVIYTLLEQWRKKKGKEEQEDAGDTV